MGLHGQLLGDTTLYKNILEFLQAAREIHIWDREPAISDSDLEKLLQEYMSFQKIKITSKEKE